VFSILLLGLLIGMRHALEADHLAAVATLASGGLSRRRTIVRGAVWGMGHTLALLAIGGVCLALQLTIPDRVSQYLELGVGVMLLGLGAEVIWRWRRQGLHVHVHRHDDGRAHLHAHRHVAGEAHDASAHAHAHASPFPRRALAIGIVHGIAGSGALVLLTVQTLGSFWLGLAYILIFGAGSILGMAALSAAIAVPLELSARRLTRLHGTLDVAIGVGTIAVGLWVVGEFIGGRV
jgi:ABC-type nickel/cobalt efflux system permease component RcnA